MYGNFWLTDTFCNGSMTSYTANILLHVYLLNNHCVTIWQLSYHTYMSKIVTILLRLIFWIAQWSDFQLNEKRRNVILWLEGLRISIVGNICSVQCNDLYFSWHN